MRPVLTFPKICFTPIHAWVLATMLLCPALLRAENDRLTGFHLDAFAIKDATVTIKPGQEIERANVVIRNGVITAVGPKAVIPKDVEVISGEGLHVYAAFLDAGDTSFLDPEKTAKPTEGKKWNVTRYVLAATRPDNRKGLTPESLAAEHLKLDAGKLEAARKAGFATIHVLPGTNLAGGQGCLVSTGGSTVRDSVIQSSTFNQFCLKRLGGSGYPTTLMGSTAHLRQAFADARHHADHWKRFRAGTPGISRPPVDQTLDGLYEVLTEKRPALFHAKSRDDLNRTWTFCDAHNLQPVIWGGQHLHECWDEVKTRKPSVILQLDLGEMPKVKSPSKSSKLTDDVPEPVRVQHDAKDRWLKRIHFTKTLSEENIPFAFSSYGLKNREELLTQMRVLIEHGLPREAALAALTSEAASLLGVQQRTGTIEPGKLANLVVFTKPFDEKSAKVRYLFTDGRRYEYNSNEKPSAKPKKKTETASPLVGNWEVTLQTEKPTKPAQLTIEADGEKLTGTFQSQLGKGKVTKVDHKDAKVQIDIQFGTDNPLKLVLKGTHTDDSMQGTTQAPFGGEFAWNAKRSSQEEEPKPEKPAIADRIPEDDLPSELSQDRLARPFETKGNVLIEHATILTATGETLKNASLLVEKGKIIAIGNGVKAPEGIRRVDASGKYVMPGIIDTHSHIMITDGINESSQSIVPEVRVKDVVNSQDPAEYRAVAGGVTTARLLHGSANVVGGQDAVVKLKLGATAQQHILDDAPQGVKFALGENVKYRTTRFPNTRLGVEATLNRAFMEALDYRRKWNEFDKLPNKNDVLPPRRDLRLEALADIVNHKKFIHSHCYRADEILMLLRVASGLGIRVWSLQHVLEGYKIAPEIAAHGASCSTFADWWAYKVEAYDATPYNAALLNEAGANVVIKSDDDELIRHLYHEAAKTVRYGNMPVQDALRTITINAARELGLDDRIGSLEVGKDGDFAIYNGHPFNSFARCEMTFIEGELYFSREKTPTAMTAKAINRTKTPTKLEFTPKDVRDRTLDISETDHGRYALVNATLYPVDQPMIAAGTVLVEDGKIVSVGKDIDIPDGFQTIDCEGLHIAPGFIDAGTQLGLTEIGKVRETHDYSEGGNLQPDLRAGVGLNVDSELIPVARTGGITTIMIRPSGGVISGQTSIAQLSGWTAPEMVQEYEAGLQVIWTTSQDRQKELKEFLEEARIYDRLRKSSQESDQPDQILDPRLEALRPYINRKKPVFIEAESRKAIAQALLFAEEEKLDIIITGGTDAWKLADELKQRNTSVILGPVMRSPVENYDPSDAPYANPNRLFEAGVKFCIRSDDASNSRNAPFEAAMAAAFGLPVDQALRSVTLSAAEILGIEKSVGSMTQGKRANLVILDGHPLQHTSNIKGVFIAGKPFPPDSRQIRFYNRYRQRLSGASSTQK